MKINTPIPPHFNVYYTGWSIGMGQGLTGPYYDIHHPQGDMKKSAKTEVAATITNYPCHVVTEVVDVVLNFLFGWIVQKEIRTRWLCTYTESPMYAVPFFSQGIVEKGSSGSGLINSNGRIIGTLSGGSSTCDFPLSDVFGRLNTAWQNSSALRRALMPSEGFAIGVDGRQITCHENLLDLHGNYYPAKEYQANNQIRLRANNNLSSNSDSVLTIYSNAEFVFEAGQSITLNSGFTALEESDFTARIAGSCSSNARIGGGTDNSALMDEILTVSIPAQKSFVNPSSRQSENDEELILENESRIKIYPNPSNGVFTIKVSFAEIVKTVNLEVKDAMGKVYYLNHYYNTETINDELNLEFLPPGIYNLNIISAHKSEYIKIAIQK